MNHDSEWNLQYQTVCQKAFAEINQKLDRIDKLLRGNGDDVGIKTRLDRLEQSEIVRRKQMWIIVTACVMGLVSLVVALVSRM